MHSIKKNSLTGDLVIPNSVTEIGERAFENCTGLNGTLTLSSKLGKIGQYAFYGCTGFTGSLKLHWIQWHSNAVK